MTKRLAPCRLCACADHPGHRHDLGDGSEVPLCVRCLAEIERLEDGEDDLEEPATW